MNFQDDHDTAEELSKLLLDTIMRATPPLLPERFASVESLQTLHRSLLSLRAYLYAAANGDLSGTIALKGYIGGALKTLQANLKHMIWQTKMITAGDFTQRIDFMGEFAQSINAMVTQLDQTLQEVAKKDKELSKANAELLKEISIRKQTEAALREREEAFKQLAITDPLTGLYNRRHFNHLAEIEISRVLRYSRPLSIVMFDIDFFKRVNDAFGHASGDMVLQVVANTITENVRATDIPSRYGGEEFIILFPETTAADAEKIAETLRKTIEAATIPGENGSIAITASFGVNDYFEKADARSPEKVLREFINRADRAMYASKNAGRNRVTIYNPDEETAP